MPGPPPIRLTTDVLVDLGYGQLTEAQATELLRVLYETLESLVGLAISARMTADQLKAFEVFFEARDDAGALAWLTRNFPDYREMVAGVYDSLASELREIASGRLAGAPVVASSHDSGTP